MKLSLPYPISANRYWRTYGGRNGHPNVVVSDEAQAYKTQVGWLARKAGLRAPIGGYLELHVVLHPIKPKTIVKPSQEVRCIDLDNALKVTLDALQGVAYPDDSNVRRIVAERGEAIDGGGVDIEIRRFEERKAA